MNERERIKKRIKENLELGNSPKSIRKHFIKIYNKELVEDVIKKYNKKERLKTFLIRTRKREEIRRFFLIIIGIFLALIILEVSLRIGGVIISLEQDSLKKETRNLASEQEEYIILALGESTTAGGENSWPSQLEKILNERSSKINFKVYNGGVGGTTTAFILSRLKEDLDEYKPDMVIAMMGINDKSFNKGLTYKEDLDTKWTLFLRDFRLYKLGRWLLSSWKNKVNSWNDKLNFKEDQLVNALMDKYYTENETLSEQERLKEAEIILKEVLKIREDYEAYTELGFVYYDLEELEKAEEMFKKSIHINQTKNRWAYYGLEELYKFGNLSNIEIKELYNQFGYSFDINTNQDFEATEYHFRLMFSVLNETGIKFVVMQYPTLDISELKEIFNGNDNIIFISNEENFNKALKTGKYEDLFIDHIRPTFGHATQVGNRLIAENVANVLEEHSYIK